MKIVKNSSHNHELGPSIEAHGFGGAVRGLNEKSQLTQRQLKLNAQIRRPD